MADARCRWIYRIVVLEQSSSLRDMLWSTRRVLAIKVRYFLRSVAIKARRYPHPNAILVNPSELFVPFRRILLNTITVSPRCSALLHITKFLGPLSSFLHTCPLNVTSLERSFVDTRLPSKCTFSQMPRLATPHLGSTRFLSTWFRPEHERPAGSSSVRKPWLDDFDSRRDCRSAGTSPRWVYQ